MKDGGFQPRNGRLCLRSAQRRGGNPGQTDVGCVCDNQLFIKPTATNVDLLARPEPAAPYEGAKPCWRIEDLEDRKTLASLVERTCAELKQGGKKRNGQEEFPWTEKDC